MPTESAPAKKPKFAVWHAFTQPAAWTMFLLGFSSGLPFLLVSYTVAIWLRKHGIVLKEITMIASAGMFYALKFLWAPLLDHVKLPGALGRLGQRRSWLLLAQLAVMVGLMAMAKLTPTQLPLFVAATLVVAFFGATQDIAVDAYRIEIAPTSSQGALVATYSLGYRIALIVTGAGALILADHLDWPVIYLVFALTMLVPMLATLFAREPEVVRTTPHSWRAAMQLSVVDPFADFFRRFGWLLAGITLLFILLFKIPEQATVGGVMGPFYLDMGFTQTQIGTITKLWGVWIGIVGVFVGGAAVARWGAWRSLGVSMVLAGASNLG